MESVTNLVTSFSVKFSKIFSPLKFPSKSVIENFYPLAHFGHCLGFVPLQNIFPKFQGSHKLGFKFFSYPVLYTIILNTFLYFFVLEPTFHYYQDGFGFKFKTDAIALKIFFGAYSLTKASMQFFTIWRSPQILNCLKSLENYDSKFHHKNETRILNRFSFIFFTLTLLSSVFNAVATFSDTHAKTTQNFLRSDPTYRNSTLHLEKRYWSLILVPQPLTVTIFSFITHQIAELSMFFSQGTIAFLVNCICDRLKAISVEIKDIQYYLNPELEEEVENQGDCSRVENNGDKNILEIQSSHATGKGGGGSERGHNLTLSSSQEVNKIRLSVARSSWSQQQNFLSTSIFQEETHKLTTDSDLLLCRLKTIKKKVLSLMDVCRRLNVVGNEIILIFTIGSTVIIVSLLYLIVMFTTSISSAHDGQALASIKSGDIKTNSVTTTTVILIAFLTQMRLLNFANTGYKLENSVSRLNNSVKRLDVVQSGHYKELDITTYLTYLCFVTADPNVSLSGCGFFRLNRATLTGIIGPLITFIVILAQFRVADIQYFGRNGTTVY